MKLYFHFSVDKYANTYLIGPDEGNEAILIDPGKIDLDLIEQIEKNNYTISSVLLTHRHLAHTQGVGTLLKIYNPTIYVGAPSFYEMKTVEVHDHSILDLAGILVEPLHIPGHTIDSFVYRIGNFLFTGDTLFAGKIGNTTQVLHTALLLKGIKEKILSLDQKTIIFPGHGALSTLKLEMMFNQNIIEAMAIDDLKQLSHPSVLT